MKPQFSLTPRMVSLIAEIIKLETRLKEAKIRYDLCLRRELIAEAVHGSIAIEQNSLSLEQVTAILNGSRVKGPEKDIKEAENALRAYDAIDLFDPFSMDALKHAHSIISEGLIREPEEAGKFRKTGVCVADERGNILHIGTLPEYIYGELRELFEWVEGNSELHMLIRAAAFHASFEMIHPFADGNGRTGRLWQTVLLGSYDPLYLMIPTENLIWQNQAEYYEALNTVSTTKDSTSFIEFMLSMTEQALEKAFNAKKERENEDIYKDMDEGPMILKGTTPSYLHRAPTRWELIDSFLRENGSIRNEDVRRMFSVSPATASRILSSLTKEKKIVRVKRGKVWAYLRMPR